MSKRKPLEFDDASGMPKCGECATHFFDEPFLVEACASVGIERGKSSRRMLREYLSVYHANKHKAPVAGPRPAEP